MRIGVTSKNKLKVEAVRKAYSALNQAIEVIGYSAESCVGEQPINEQVLEGARNRIVNLTGLESGLDRIISIENGIFREGDQWLDKAVVVIYNLSTGAENNGYSDSIIFPDEYVEKARQIGFDTMTVGQVMEQEGHVANGKDPHLTISGISRQIYLERVVQKLVEETEGH